MKIIITILFIIFGVHISAQSIDSVEFESVYNKLIAVNSKANQIKYLEIFPESFESFIETFGYENGKPAPMYYDSYQYMLEFFKLDSIPIDIKMDKWIDISINGHWEADAVNYFQNELRIGILNNVDLTYRLLEKRSDFEIESFFYFFFDEPHPKYKTIPTQFDEIINDDIDFYNLIEKGHHQAIIDSGH